MPLRAVLFDAYGTLFDVHSVALAAESLFPGHGEPLSLLWRDKQIEYSRLVSMSSGAAGDHYRPFAEITQAALRFAALKRGLELGTDAEALLLDAYRRLAPFAENRAVLATLRQRGITAGVLSNGDPEMLRAVVRHAGFETLLQHLISVDACRRYKTDPAAYALGPQTLGLAARDILFVSSNAWDAIGATWFGYTTLWVNRSSAPPEQLGTTPHHTGRSLNDVLPLLLQEPGRDALST